MNFKNIYLVGMPGVGKSYWAEHLATKLNYNCIDLDHIIEVRCRMPIAEIFKKFGEAHFRQLEAETLQQIMTVFPSKTVIACGGGTPCFGNNLASMKKNGLVIYLKATLKHLYENLSNELKKRPLINEANWQEKLSQMLDKRALIFEQAHIITDATRLSLDSLANDCLNYQNQAH